MCARNFPRLIPQAHIYLSGFKWRVYHRLLKDSVTKNFAERSFILGYIQLHLFWTRNYNGLFLEVYWDFSSADFRQL